MSTVTNSSAVVVPRAKHPPDETPEDNNKRKRNSENQKLDSSKAIKKSKNYDKSHHTRRESSNNSNDDDDDINNNNDERQQTPSKGSFADASMRAAFGVSLPPPDPSSLSPEPTHAAKRKVALLLAYCGTRYAGFQSNPLQRTVQAEIELALYRAGMLSKHNFGFPYKYGWSHAARTDKGVHACAQVCSAKLAIGDRDGGSGEGDSLLEDVRNRLNEQLPDDICVLDVKKTARNFCAKTARDCARYQYMFPSYLLYDRNELRKLMESVLGSSSNDCHQEKEQQQEGRRVGNTPLTVVELNQLRKTLTQFRATSTQMELLSKTLKSFEGTHSFHNFTNGKTSDDPSASRYIMSFDATMDPIVMENGVEWIVTNVTGQSFLLHQIRKMICLAIDIARGSASPEFLAHALDKATKVHVSLAPAQGLFLDMSYFDQYNQRVKQKKIPVEYLDWSWEESSSSAAQRWKRFKEDVVLKHIVEEEQRDGNFIQYLYLQEFVFDFDTLYKVVRESKSEVSTNKGRSENVE